jgi:hypothetical protein
MKLSIDITQQQQDRQSDFYYWRVHLRDDQLELHTAVESEQFEGVKGGNEELIQAMIDSTEIIIEHKKKFHRAG